MRLIDADALRSYMDECSKEIKFRVYYGYAESFINNAPTIDAVPVVRCRECKHWDGSVCDVHSEWPDQYSTGHMDYTEADDFCSYGERKEGACNEP